MLKTLQNRIAMIHKFDAEIELLIGDEDELANELEQQTDFHVSASVSIAKLSALIENYKKEHDRLRVSFKQTLLRQIQLHRVE